MAKPYTLRDLHRSLLISLLNNRRCKRYRTGVLQFAVLCSVIDNDEWGRLFHKVRCQQRKFTQEDLCEPS